MIFGNILLFIRCRNQNQIKWTKTQNSQLLFWGISMGIFVKCFIWSINFVLFSQSLVSKSYLQLWICLGFVNSTCCKGHEIRRKRQEDFNLVKIKAIRYEKPKFSEIQFKSILLYIRAANMLGVTDTGPSLQELVHQYRYFDILVKTDWLSIIID